MNVSRRKGIVRRAIDVQRPKRGRELWGPDEDIMIDGDR